ncbi:membrane protein [Candidatus Magnetomorum sp. HK-1]|nr:membrane protein [Candidatus Magnetomorum sp. HK-1]
MENIFKIAGAISTPLALSGLFSAIFFLLLKQIIAKNIFPSLTKQFSSDIIKLIIHYVFILSILTILLGFVGYIFPIIFAQSSNGFSINNYDTMKGHEKLIIRYAYQGSSSIIEVNNPNSDQIEFILNVGEKNNNKDKITYSYKYLPKPKKLTPQNLLKIHNRCKKYESNYDLLICEIQNECNLSKEEAINLILTISSFININQVYINYLVSSYDDLKIKIQKINKIINQYYYNFTSVQIPNAQKVKIDKFPIKDYLIHLAKLNNTYSKIEFYFDPLYMSFGTICQIDDNQYELLVGVWRIYRAWSIKTLEHEDATRMKLRLILTINNSKAKVKIVELMASEVISLVEYQNKY